MVQIEKIDGMYKWALNNIVDDDSERIGDNGYFGAWHKIQIDGKQAIVFCDDRDALCITAINEWFDEVIWMNWSGDHRWNWDLPAIVRRGDKFNILSCPKGGMRGNEKKMRILSDEWFDEMVTQRWKHSDVLKGNYLEVRIGNEVVQITPNGSIIRENPQVLLSVVSHYSKSEILEKWIKKGKRCVYREGWAYRGASARELSMDKAIEMLDQYSFGKGFYQLGWKIIDGRVALEFNELSVLDME